MRKGKDYDEAVRLYQSGMSIKGISDRYGITRQAMWKILKRRDVLFRSNLKYGVNNHFYIDGKGYEPHQEKAKHATKRAISKGALIPGSCEVCGFVGTGKDGRNLVEAHHDDYSQPLAIRWMCRKCHYALHYKAS